MIRDKKPLPRPGTGVVGFGCTSIVVLIGGIPAVLDSDWRGWTILAAVAVVAGLLAARFGESVFERILDWLPFD